ncbi:MAG: Fe(3+) dicitrate transport protein [Pyrinomonadaceae bacterium]|jgi:Fe(3+) dicitrate transport protein|nr:Fe(3+) dicitrate transport protein [Pyrinomonadaceae bacterium]
MTILFGRENNSTGDAFNSIGRRALLGLIMYGLLAALLAADAYGAMIQQPQQPQSQQSQDASAVIVVQARDAHGDIVAGATVVSQLLPGGAVLTHQTGTDGSVTLLKLPPGQYRITVSKPGFAEIQREVSLSQSESSTMNVVLDPQGLNESVTVAGRAPDETGIKPDVNGIARMEDVQGLMVYAGKKNEVLVLDKLNANVALGNTRQVFAKVPGTNVWEIDSSGLQVGVSNRGLDPNRSWEVNSRQNGYDITADIFGYPEAYFTPPLEAVERVEVVRGASSLQYGAQFGGLVNYVLKEAPAHRRFTFTTEQTGGANGLFNSHTRAGGTLGKFTYNGYYHHRQADGYRDNAGFEADTGFGSIRYELTERLKIGFELTTMGYALQMAGGLTEEMFKQNPRASVRPRNHFHLQWLVPALKLDYKIDRDTRVSLNVFGVRGTRHSLFNSQPVVTPDGRLNPDDPNTPRTLFQDRFRNHGAEARLLTNYEWFGRKHTLATGFRYSNGKTIRQQGLGATGLAADFTPLVPDFQRNLHFRNINLAGFAENIFRVTNRLTITPGFRYDHIDSTASGAPIIGKQKQSRSLPLFGVGAAYQVTEGTSLYGNVSQAYRATLFNDQWRPDPSIIVDQNLKDMSGYVLEFGYRGHHANWLNFDVGGFYLKYHNRLGLLTPQNTPGQTVSLWTNVADSRNVGLESFVEVDLLRAAHVAESRGSLSLFSSIAQIDASYLNGIVKGNRVESAPDSIIRSGLTYRLRGLSATLQFSRVSEQFSDANNTRATVDAVQGLIPAYRVWDLSGSYKFKRHYTVRGGMNNLADATYYTRRASSYPGPGLIPADGRTFYLSFGFHY